MKPSKKALERYNKCIIRSALSTVERYNQKLETFNNPTLNKMNANDKKQIPGLLPITPTVVRVKSPRIINYLGFD